MLFEVPFSLSREDAYVLCSLAGDPKIFDLVDAGMFGTSALTMVLSVFTRT